MSIDGNRRFLEHIITLVILGTCENDALPIAHTNVEYKENNLVLKVRC